MKTLRTLSVQWLWRVLLALCLGVPGWAHAQAIQCTSPPTYTLSATPNANYTYPKGASQDLFLGNVTWTYTNCTRIAGLGWFERTIFNPTATPLGGTSGVYIVGSNHTLTRTSCNWSGTWQPSGSNYGVNFSFGAASTCASMVFSVDIRIFTDGTGSGGTYNSATSTPLTSTGLAWINGGGLGYRYTPNFTTVFAALGCTLTTANTTATLPRIGVSALTGNSPTAGRTAFDIGLTGCVTGGTGYLASATWSFSTGPQATFIANSASAPVASNVYVQLLDSSFNPIGNGSTTTLTNIADGQLTGTARYYAQYATPGSPGSGNVKGIAQLTLTFN